MQNLGYFARSSSAGSKDNRSRRDGNEHRKQDQRERRKGAQLELGMASGGARFPSLGRAKRPKSACPNAGPWFLHERPGAKKPNDVGNAQQGYQAFINQLQAGADAVAEELLEISKQEGVPDLPVHIVDSRGCDDMLIQMWLRHAAEVDDPERVFSPEIILHRWESLQSILPDDAGEERFDRLLGKVVQATDFCHKVISESFLADRLGLYAVIARRSLCAYNGFAQWAARGLEQLAKEAWHPNPEGDWPAVQLLLILKDNGVTVQLGPRFQDAAEELAEGVRASSEIPPDEIQSRWGEVLSSLDPASRKELGRRVLRDIIAADGEASAAFFDMYAKELFDKDVLVENHWTVSSLFVPIIRNRDLAALRWLHAFLSSHTDFLGQFSDESSVQAFYQRLRDSLSAEEAGEPGKLVNAIADVVGVRGADGDAANGDESDREDESGSANG